MVNAEGKLAPAGGSRGRERPQIATFVFADLAGFTALTEAHGDTQAADVAADFVAGVRALLEEYSATEVKTIGDALLVRVCDPLLALRLAARIVGDSAVRHRSLGVRVGMHTGTAVRRGEDWFGAGVNVASRVADEAGANEVLMTVVTRDLIDARVALGQLRSRGEHRLKNVPDPVELFVLHTGSATPPLSVDPVCRMAVAPAQASETFEHDGITYHFCSPECASAFHAGPARYLPRS